MLPRILATRIRVLARQRDVGCLKASREGMLRDHEYLLVRLAKRWEM